MFAFTAKPVWSGYCDNRPLHHYIDNMVILAKPFMTGQLPNQTTFPLQVVVLYKFDV